MTDWERGGKSAYHGPPCRCGSRATRRVGHLQRKCSACGKTYHYRLYDGLLLAMERDTAAALDDERRSGCLI